MIMTDERFSRTAMLLGEEALSRLFSSRVMLFGLGGVGGYACEALARAGVGHLFLCDFDTVSISNINRQILADDTTVGQKKTAVAAERVRRIHPSAEVTVADLFVDEKNALDLIASFRPDYIIDAIDAVPSKIALIAAANTLSVPIISCMGTGNKLDPEKLTIADISKTHTCPLARAVRTRLRAVGISHVDVLFSTEKPITPQVGEGEKSVPASVPFVPSVAGLMLGGFVIRRLSGVGT